MRAGSGRAIKCGQSASFMRLTTLHADFPASGRVFARLRRRQRRVHHVESWPEKDATKNCAPGARSGGSVHASTTRAGGEALGPPKSHGVTSNRSEMDGTLDLSRHSALH